MEVLYSLLSCSLQRASRAVGLEPVALDRRCSDDDNSVNEAAQRFRSIITVCITHFFRFGSRTRIKPSCTHEDGLSKKRQFSGFGLRAGHVRRQKMPVEVTPTNA